MKSIHEEAPPISLAHQDPGHQASLAEAVQMAVSRHQAGQLDEAAAMYREILQTDCTNAHVHYLLGAVCEGLGRLDEAVVHLEQSARLRPGFAQVHNHLGVVRGRQGNFAVACACFQEAVRLQPDYAEARQNFAHAAQDLARSRLATALSFVAAKTAAQLHTEGLVFVHQGRMEEALNSLREAILLRPDFVEAHSNLGKALGRQGRYDEAIASLRRAVELRPDMFEAHFSLGNMLRQKGLLEEAAASYQQAVRLRPKDFAVHSSLGGVLLELGQPEAALVAHRDALQLQPDSAETYNNLGVALMELRRVDEALHYYEESIRLQPDYAEAHKNRGIALLAQGDFAQGWPEYQWSWEGSAFTPADYPQPRWDGTRLGGRTILLYAEQDLGDTIQFIRYVPLVRGLGGRVLLMCPRPLHRLLRRGLEIDHLLGPGEEPPPFDVHAPLPSLPALLGTTLNTIPADVPYLHADQELVERWGGELQAVGGLKVGIAWQGSVERKCDRFQSAPLDAFTPLAAVDRIRLVTLQTPETEPLRRLLETWNVLDTGSREDDLADTAALMKSLDLVVTVDTALGHLAGALAIPVWVALPFAADWHWLLGREDSPWYPTMRLFRQGKQGNWADVFAQIAAAAVTLLGRAR